MSAFPSYQTINYGQSFTSVVWLSVLFLHAAELDLVYVQSTHPSALAVCQ